MLQPRPDVPPRAHFSRKPATALLASLLAASFWTGHPMTAEAAEVAVELEAAEAPAPQSYEVPVTAIAASTVLLTAERDSVEITWRAPVQWPVAEGSPIGNGFGYRGEVCAGCSTYHLGVDLFPGYGAPAMSIADGVVTTVSSNGGWGSYVVVEHTINGQRVNSLYAHLIPGSAPVVPGQFVEVGQSIGQVGNSGTTTATHLHFELTVGGAHVDPVWWLRNNIPADPTL
ncbi:M23 family metallopeptidase [Microcella sp.]|uniref:M23 family metallopeptidase n=1 Tax=Microcella sp. TaxID=1913979 RepID=UPI00391997C6